MKRFALLIFALAAAPALAQNDAVNGFCTLGASKALVSNLASSNMQQGMIPKCTVTVYLTGTTTPATIFSNAGGTVLLNPFTAAVSGQWLFYAATGQGLDVVMSGGTPPIVFPSPVTLTDIKVGGGGGGGALFPSTPAVVVNTSTLASRNAVFTDIVPLFGGGACVGFLKNDGTCATSSGSPGGTQTQIQFNNSGAFGGSKTTTDLATGLQLNAPILNGSYDAFKFQTNPTSNDGIANAETAAGTNGTTTANPNYPYIEVGGNLPVNGSLFDLRMGFRHYATNPFIGSGLTNIGVNATNCWFDYVASSSATDQQFCDNNGELFAGIGNDSGGGVTTVQGSQSLHIKVRNGISAVNERVIDCWADGDCHADRYTFATQGLNSDLSREGYGAFMPHFIQEAFVFNSNVVSVTDSTHIKVNPSGVGGAYGTQLGGGWLVNKNNSDTGNIVADNAPSGGIANRSFTTSNTHTPSAAGGVTTTILNSPANFVAGDPTPVTVTKKWGTWPASGNVCISGDHTYETTFSGSSGTSTVTMLIQSRYEEPIGSTIVVGSCAKMFSNVDRLVNSQGSGTSITSEIAVDIIGAPDANTYLYTLTGVATRDGNALNGSYNWRTDTSMAQIAGMNVTRDAANNITFPADSGNNGTGYLFMGTRTITMTGCTPSNFNFGPTSVTLPSTGNPFGLLFVQPGSILGASSATGCTLTMSGFNGFTLHKAAKVISASDPTVAKNVFPFTGYYQLGVNTVGWTAGDPVEQPSGNSILIDQISEVAGMTPTLGGQPSHPILDWTCKAVGLTTAGQCSGGMTPISIANQAPYSQYKGGGGLYSLMTMANISGPWGTYWNYLNAPANGGIYAFLGCPPEGCNTGVPYKLFSLAGAVGGDLTFTPSTGLLSWQQTFHAPTLDANLVQTFNYKTFGGLFMGQVNGATQFNCISLLNGCSNAIPDDAEIIADSTHADKNFYINFLLGGTIRFRTWQSGSTFNYPCLINANTFDCSVGAGGLGTGAGGKFTALTVPGIADGCATWATGVLGSTGVACGSGGGGGVASINGTVGAFTFTGAGVSCTTTTCTFSGSGVSSFNTRTGAVTPTSGDYNFGLISGNLGTGQGPTSLTGILKDAAGTLTAAVAADFPTLNQSTTGSAAKWTTARNLAGNSVDGSANVNFANKVILQGTTDAGFPNAQFLGALATGLVKNTTTTGVLSIAVSADVIGLWTGTCSSSTFLRGDGACAAPTGSGNTTSTSLTTNTVPKANGANSIINSGITDDGTKMTYTGSGTANGMQIPEGTAITGLAANDNLWADSTAHRWVMNPNNAGALMIPGIATAGTSGHFTVLASNGIDIQDGGALGTGVVTFLATPTSANLAAAVTDETGTGALVFGTAPTITLGNGTGLPISTGVSGLATGAATFLGSATSANLRALITDESGTGAALFAGGNIGAATGTSLLVTGNIDGTAPLTITTGTTATLGGTFKSGYTLNQEATAATAVAYTLPTAAAGLQYCVGNSWNGSAATTGVLTVNTSASGQFIIFTDGTLSATGGNVTSGGAAGDAACFVGVDATHWQQYTQRGTWSKH